MSQLTQLTIRGFDVELERRLKLLAAQEGLSLNQAALTLMRRGAGLESSRGEYPIGDAIDQFAGVWTDEEAAEFRAALREFDRIDPEMWQ